MLSGGDLINIRTTPLENTTIKSGGRKRNPNISKMAKRPQVSQTNKLHRNVKANIKRSDSDSKRRRSSLLRRLSSKRASADVHQLIPHNASLPPPSTPPTSPLSTATTKMQNVTPSRSYTSLPKTSAPDLPNSSLPSSSSLAKTSTHLSVHSGASMTRLLPSSSSSIIQNVYTDSANGNSSVESSPSNSVPNSPASSTRPSSLDGLKFKLKQTFRPPRRKSCGHIPLSPLARSNGGASPVLIAAGNNHLLASTSPTSRSPSPLAIFPIQSSASQTSTSSSIIQKHHRLAPIAQSSSGLLSKKLRPKSVIVEKCFHQKRGDSDCKCKQDQDQKQYRRFSSTELQKNFSLSKSKRECLALTPEPACIRLSQPTIKVETTALQERPESVGSVEEEDFVICRPDASKRADKQNSRSPTRDLPPEKGFNRVSRSSSDPPSKDKISKSLLSRNSSHKSLQSLQRSNQHLN